MTYVRVPVPRISPGMGTNLLGVAGLLAIVCAIASLTSWRWGLLAAGLFAVALTVIAQAGAAQASPAAAGGNVTPIEQARQGRISATAEAQLAAERTAELPRVDAAL